MGLETSYLIRNFEWLQLIFYFILIPYYHIKLLPVWPLLVGVFHIYNYQPMRVRLNLKGWVSLAPLVNKVTLLDFTMTGSWL